MRRASFGAVDDARPDARRPLDRRQEFAAVFRFPRRARGRGQDFIDLVGARQPLELRQRLECRRHGLRGQLASIEAAGAETDHLFFAIDDLKEKSGRTRTTIMCTELVPMSIAASRICYGAV